MDCSFYFDILFQSECLLALRLKVADVSRPLYFHFAGIHEA